MPSLPDRYPFAESVPKGGSSCANCHYLSEHGTCHNKFYRKENGGSGELGDKPDQFCCIAWSRKSRT